MKKVKGIKNKFGILIAYSYLFIEFYTFKTTLLHAYN